MSKRHPYGNRSLFVFAKASQRGPSKQPSIRMNPELVQNGRFTDEGRRVIFECAAQAIGLTEALIPAARHLATTTLGRKEIANRLGIPKNTLDSQIARAFGAMGVHSREEFALGMMERGLLILLDRAIKELLIHIGTQRARTPRSQPSRLADSSQEGTTPPSPETSRGFCNLEMGPRFSCEPRWGRSRLFLVRPGKWSGSGLSARHRELRRRLLTERSLRSVMTRSTCSDALHQVH